MFFVALLSFLFICNANVNDWYQVSELKPNLFLVREPAEASFFILKNGDQALFIDSGLGIDIDEAGKLLKKLEIKTFKVLVTHAHCDHVGLNGLAHQVFINKDEWAKYLKHHDEKQIGFYYKLLKNVVPWPQSIQTEPKQLPWKPSVFLRDHQAITFGKWNLEAISLPGHTVGHMAFIDRKEKIFFLGDFIYNGTLSLLFHLLPQFF